MNIEIAKIKGNAKQNWAYELNNWLWIEKKLVDNYWAKIWDWIKYEFTFFSDNKKIKNILEIIDIISWLYKNKYEIEEYWHNKFIVKENNNWDNLDYSTNNPDLFEQIPKEVVKLFKWWGLTTTKLRQYYEIIVNLYNAYSKKKEFSVNELKTDINIFLAKINYDINRQGSKVPQEMYDFVKYHKNQIFENEDKVLNRFKIFRKHFETVVAYSVWELKK